MKDKNYPLLKHLFKQYQESKLPEQKKKLIDNWFDSHDAETPSDILNDPETERRIYQQLNDRIRQGMYPAPVRTIWSSGNLLKAACLIGVLFFAVGLYYRNKPRTATTQQQAYQIINTTNGQVKTVKLADSTEISLNAATTIRIPLFGKDSNRIVYLDRGEAFFKVKHDPSRPFSVISANLITRDIGTSFNIRAYDIRQEYRVAVASGEVDVCRIGHSGKLQIISKSIGKGQVLSYSPLTQKVQLIQKDAALISSWRWGGVLDLEAMSLQQIGDELERHFNIRVTVTHPQLDPTIYTFHLGQQTLNEVLQRLTLRTGITYSLDQNHLTINAPDKRMK